MKPRGGLLQRLAVAPRALSADQQLAGLAAVGLLVSLLLPWYEKSVAIRGRFVSDSVSAFGAVSFVEAAVFLVAAGVLVLLFTRAERRAYELPGGDGTVIFAAGVWAAVLIFWRVFDRPDVAGQAGTVGIQWGFFVAFVAAGSLASAGWRLRQRERGLPARPPRPAGEGPPGEGPPGEGPPGEGRAGDGDAPWVARAERPTEPDTAPTVPRPADPDTTPTVRPPAGPRAADEPPVRRRVPRPARDRG